MKVVLLVDVKKVGRKGEVVEVANGYAQSVLLPRKLALPGTPENVKKAEKQVASKEDKKAFDNALLAKTLKDLNGKIITLQVKSNENGTLFTSVHEKHILDAIKSQSGAALAPGVLKMKEVIKKAGEHTLMLEGAGEKVSITVVIK